MNPFKGAAAVLAVFVAVVVVCVALFAVGWKLHWWSAKQGAANQYQVDINTSQWQTARVTEERDRVTALTTAQDPGQRTLIKSQFCQIYLDLTQPPQDLVMAHAQFCS